MKKRVPESEGFIYPPKFRLVAGVDEVGRGALVGNVVAAAVILDPINPVKGLRDSKKLSEIRRLTLSAEIREKALAWSVGCSSPQEIDELNILSATMIAMRRAVDGLAVTPDYILFDGNRVPRKLECPASAIVKGDMKVPEISAASILAKVARDEEMITLDKRHPHFGFAKHKGYPTKMHLRTLKRYNTLDSYRKSFKPVQQKLALRVSTE